MYQNLIDYLQDKKIAILGFGREGKSTYNFIRKVLPNKKITIIDKLKEVIMDYKDNNTSIIYGDNYLTSLNEYELIIKTPGISLIGVEITTEITSQFDLLLRFIPVKVIGITGTKGKSTTSSLIYQIIHDQIDNSYLVGNIGIPVFDIIEKLTQNSIIVAEMSAHQLKDIKKSPTIGIILNLYEEHLDYFLTKSNYYNAKLNMFKYQTKEDYALYYDKNVDLKELITEFNLNSNIIFLNEDQIINGKYIKDDILIYDYNKGQKLIGKLNEIDILFALEVSRILKLDITKTEKTIRNFEPLPHRMNLIGTYQNISFYDDTLATIPKATINSINALKDVDTIIIGGMDRKIDYIEFTNDLLKTNVSNIICQPETGLIIYDLLKKLTHDKNVIYIDDLEKAVIKAYEITKKGKKCLLSPAASSYNVYKSFEEKSAKYKEYIEKYSLQ